jgi:hypothetical protein
VVVVEPITLDLDNLEVVVAVLALIPRDNKVAVLPGKETQADPATAAPLVV